MIRPIIHHLAVACALLTITSGIAKAQGGASKSSYRVAVVDMTEILRGYYKTGESEENLRKVRAESQKDVDELVLERQTSNRELRQLAKEKQDDPAKAQEYDQLLNELKALEQQIQQAEQANEKRIRQLHRKTRFELMEDIVKQVETYAKENGYPMVIDVSATSPIGAKMTPYHKKELNVTSKIIEALNAKQAK